MTDKVSERLGLSGWVERIHSQDMPVFGRTVEAVRMVTRDDMASASMLSRVVLQDPALTTKVLKLANSVLFNPTKQNVSTVSRAIIVLGFNMVGDIVLSIRLIDTLLSGGLRERVLKEMARCFHAAAQARTAAGSKGVLGTEEVFIAALLGRVGEMAFWCFGGNAARGLDEAMQAQPEEKPEELQMDLLGFRLRNLTAALAKEWSLGPLVVAGAEPSSHPTIEEQAIAQGYKLAVAVEQGWETSTARAALASYASFVGKPLDELTHELASNAAEATRVAAQFGAVAAARLIPVPPGQDQVDLEKEAKTVEPVQLAPTAQLAAAGKELAGGWITIGPGAPEAIEAEEIAQELTVSDPAPDQLLQLKILRDLSMILAGKPSLNEVLQLVLEGIYRGLGMSRAVFALQTADRLQVVGKTALGRDADALLQRFSFALDGTKGEVINELFEHQKAFWLKEPRAAGLRTHLLERITGQTDGFLAPIVANGRVIGLFYADCYAHQPDDETWQGFLHFVQQASLSFEHVAARNRK
ncbi:MAG TPA: HDOD domain-containing protein [Rhodocyclaceae bacterium]|nr:HDOD domain-containing protein [Rhodocyclaceae bacterium]